MSLLFVGATLALRVSYNGKTIATVRNRAQFEAAATLVTRTVNGSSSEIAGVVKEPVFTSALVLSSSIDSQQDVALAIIENTDDIIAATAITVNGRLLACTTEEGLAEEIERCRTRFETEGTQCTSEFLETPVLEQGYYLKSGLKTLEQIRPLIEAIPVRTTVLAVTDTAIPYKTEQRENAQKERGWSAVVSEGCDGILRVGESVTLIDGIETERVPIESCVVREPVTRVVEIGTARSASSGSTVTVSGLILPLPSGVWQVSAYFGDGRGHRGIDLRSPAGTSIYAAASGTVTSAGWDGDYGYCVVINHGNGFETRYAHASSLYVKAGQTVCAGEEIAAVGRTGNASGNHLHFEIILNGTRVDPAPSLGIN